MLNTNKLIEEATNLPVELRAKLIETLLKSLNPAQDDIDKLWAIEAERRISEVESGHVQPVDGGKVFADLRKRLN
jgi:putative addiction module component (TIGR02574 family)